MRLLDLKLLEFGPWRSSAFVFGPHLNLLCAPNEGGKTTLQQAIVGSLFGFDDGPSVDRYLSWVGQGTTATELRLELGAGQIIRINRDYGQSGRRQIQTHVWDATEKEDISHQYHWFNDGKFDFGTKHLGLDLKAFRRTALLVAGDIAVAHDGPKGKPDKDLGSLANLVGRLAASRGEASVSQARAALDKYLDKLGRTPRGNHPHGAATRRREDAYNKLQEARQRASDIAGQRQELQILEHKQIEAECDLQHAREQHRALEKRRLAARLREVHTLNLRCTELEALPHGPDVPPTGERINELRVLLQHEAASRAELSTQLRAAEQALQQAQDRHGALTQGLSAIEKVAPIPDAVIATIRSMMQVDAEIAEVQRPESQAQAPQINRASQRPHRALNAVAIAVIALVLAGVVLAAAPGKWMIAAVPLIVCAALVFAVLQDQSGTALKKQGDKSPVAQPAVVIKTSNNALSDLLRAYELPVEGDWQSAVTARRQALEHMETLKSQLDGTSRECEAYERKINQLRERLSHLDGWESELRSELEHIGIAADSLEKGLAGFDGLVAQARQERQRGIDLELAQQQLSTVLGPDTIESLEHEWLMHFPDEAPESVDTPAPSERELRRSQEEVAQASRDYNELLRRHASLLATLQGALEVVEDLPALNEEFERADRELTWIVREIEALRSAISVIDEATHKAFTLLSQRVESNLSRQFQVATESRYSRVDLQGTTLIPTAWLTDPPRQVDVTDLSKGTQDALWLLLRLNLVDALSTTGEKIPIFLDEPGAHLDAQRTRAMARTLCTVSEHVQVFVLTCHEDVAGIFYEVAGDRLHKLSAITLT
ncbi:MAG: AAA family ATPase [Chloroflexi bacterium]|nr:AAA family ATPase [Chloroflexota bacterium]